MTANPGSDEESIGRRSFLKVSVAAGAAALGLSQTGAAAAETSDETVGYGLGEYGSGDFGDVDSDGASGSEEESGTEDSTDSDGTDGSGGSTSDDSTIAVTTKDPADVNLKFARMRGSLDDLGGAESAVVGFKYRPTDEPDSDETVTVSRLTSPMSFSTTVDLKPNTEYQYQAVAATDDGESVIGEAVTFTTSPPGKRR